jgi:hypothetical protein
MCAGHEERIVAHAARIERDCPPEDTEDAARHHTTRGLVKILQDAWAYAGDLALARNAAEVIDRDPRDLATIMEEWGDQ